MLFDVKGKILSAKVCKNPDGDCYAEVQVGARVVYFELIRTAKDAYGATIVEVISDPVASVIEIAPKE